MATPNVLLKDPAPDFYYHDLSFDPVTGLAYRYGEYAWPPVNLMWSYASVTEPVGWQVQSYTGSPPNARYGVGFAYDALRARHVMYGGVLDPSGMSNQTWEFNSATSVWTQKFPATNPRPGGTYNVKMCWTGYAVMMVEYYFTWLYDGTNWASYANPTSSRSQGSVAITYDPVRDVVVLFGGEDGSGLLNDTWEWSGPTGPWVQKFPVTSPPPRHYHAMAYNGTALGVVLWGGTVEDGAGLSRSVGDMWMWDGSNWTKLWHRYELDPNLRASFHSMAWDSVHEVTIIGTLVTGIYS